MPASEINLITRTQQGTMAVSFMHGSAREVGLLLTGSASKKKENAKVVAKLIRAYNGSELQQKSLPEEIRGRASKQEPPADHNLQYQSEEDDDSELEYNSGEEEVSFSTATSTTCS